MSKVSDRLLSLLSNTLSMKLQPVSQCSATVQWFRDMGNVDTLIHTITQGSVEGTGKRVGEIMSFIIDLWKGNDIEQNHFSCLRLEFGE